MGTFSKAMDKATPQNNPNPENPSSPSLPPASQPVPSNKQNVKIDSSLFSEEQTGRMEKWDERLKKIALDSSFVTEEIRRLRNKILHPDNHQTIRSVLITSALPGEGKSFICANLGISTALGIEKNSLLVDCDLRCPTLASLFGLNNETGLVNHLQSRTDLAQLIKKTGQPKLSILPSGPSPVNPSELLDSSKMVNLINELTQRYQDRLLFLDSPPMQAAAETAVLAQHVDTVILVVRWGYSPKEQVKKAIDTIGKDKILGIVFNAFETNIIEEKYQKIKNYKNYYK